MNRIAFLVATLLVASVGTLTAGEGQHWTYEGEEGPEHWGELAAEFELCAQGRNQSPINLVADIHSDLPELVFDYPNPGNLVEINTGHAIQENVKPGNFVVFMGEKFELKQFHFHSPSEHTVNRESFPMEAHFVHQDGEGDYAVVGLMFQEGETNEMMNQLPSFRVERGEDPYSGPVDFNDLIPDRKNYFLYNGSLTTPPCSEGVQWILLKQPLIVSPDQIQHYRDLLGFDNNRPVQPHNSRIILD